jgi:hypothetical protein
MNFRVARHTNDLEAIKFFYITILGFEILGFFENHDGYDGIFIGKKELNWHLEFTKSDERIKFDFNEDDALVFYPTSQEEYNEIIKSLEINTISTIIAKNPYWNENGKMVLDPDGYRVIISNLKIK